MGFLRQRQILEEKICGKLVGRHGRTEILAAYFYKAIISSTLANNSASSCFDKEKLCYSCFCSKPASLMWARHK